MYQVASLWYLFGSLITLVRSKLGFDISSVPSYVPVKSSSSSFSAPSASSSFVASGSPSVGPPLFSSLFIIGSVVAGVAASAAAALRRVFRAVRDVRGVDFQPLAGFSGGAELTVLHPQTVLPPWRVGAEAEDDEEEIGGGPTPFDATATERLAGPEGPQQHLRHQFQQQRLHRETNQDEPPPELLLMPQHNTQLSQ
eukprot:GHVT01007379.1.p1 GENE.GHVT01007379.1~~GHVT01007379.1.p1  ORF type:complete len:197 (+),score=44.74 GHVT01007379.1:652-1242(+)